MGRDQTSQSRLRNSSPRWLRGSTTEPLYVDAENGLYPLRALAVKEKRGGESTDTAEPLYVDPENGLYPLRALIIKAKRDGVATDVAEPLYVDPENGLYPLRALIIKEKRDGTDVYRPFEFRATVEE